jgi:hypothetical protein
MIRAPGTEPTIFSDLLGQVVPVISNLIEREEVKTSMPIVNEEVTKVSYTMSQGPKYLGEETNMNTIKGDHITPN